MLKANSSNSTLYHRGNFMRFHKVDLSFFSKIKKLAYEIHPIIKCNSNKKKALLIVY
jgi:hypothetical protein